MSCANYYLRGAIGVASDHPGAGGISRRARYNQDYISPDCIFGLVPARGGCQSQFCR